MLLQTPCRARPPLLALAMALSPLLANGAGADTMNSAQPLSYSTSGAIDTTNVSGTNAISYHSMGTTAVSGSNSIDLGQFQVTALPAGMTATYANTPFTITFLPQQGGGAAGTPVVLNGVLNGVVDGSSSNVTASFTQPPGTVQTQPFPGPPMSVNFGVGTMTDTLTVANSTFDLSPAAGGGVTSVLGSVSAASVPEPATVAIFLTAIAGAGLRRRRR